MASKRGNANITALLLLLCFFAQEAVHHAAHAISGFTSMVENHESSLRRFLKLVEDPTPLLTYHSGSILSGDAAIPINILWYGQFSIAQEAIITDFFTSFQSPSNAHPTVSSWWSTTQYYEDSTGLPVKGTFKLNLQAVDDKYSKGKSLKLVDFEALVLAFLGKSVKDPRAITLVLTAQDVLVESFCMNACASHFSTEASSATGGQRLLYAWIGNSASQCPGYCAWPFAMPSYGPPDFKPLLSPNGDVGIDGMIMNLATILAGAVTNPYGNGYYQGDAEAPLEAVTACAGIFGPGAYPGYPGQLLVDNTSGDSYNARGSNNRGYLLPAMWSPFTNLCTTPS